MIGAEEGEAIKPMGAPAPPPILAAADEVLKFALGDLWWQTSAREQAALRDSLWLLQEWVTVRWPPFPAMVNGEGEGGAGAGS